MTRLTLPAKIPSRISLRLHHVLTAISPGTPCLVAALRVRCPHQGDGRAPCANGTPRPFLRGHHPLAPAPTYPRPRGNPLAPLPSNAATKLQVHYKLRIAQLEFEKEQRLLESREVAREKAALNIPGLHLAASSVLWNTGRHGELRRKA